MTINKRAKNNSKHMVMVPVACLRTCADLLEKKWPTMADTLRGFADGPNAVSQADEIWEDAARALDARALYHLMQHGRGDLSEVGYTRSKVISELEEAAKAMRSHIEGKRGE